MLYHDVLNRDFHFRPVLATTVKSVGYRQELIQFPQPASAANACGFLRSSGALSIKPFDAHAHFSCEMRASDKTLALIRH
jgi:hypothetical protein